MNLVRTRLPELSPVGAGRGPMYRESFDRRQADRFPRKNLKFCERALTALNPARTFASEFVSKTNSYKTRWLNGNRQT